MADSHLIPCTARAVHRNEFRALCGELVNGHDHARDGIPTCPECARIDAEDTQSLMALRADIATPLERPVHTTFGDTLAGYRLKGSRR